MDFVLDDDPDTPVVEQKAFREDAVKRKSPNPATLLRHETSSSGTDTDGDGDGDGGEDSSFDSDDDKDAAVDGRGAGADGRTSVGAPPSDMSNSYHEIFDAQMPPEAARSVLERVSGDRGEEDYAVDGAAAAVLLPCDNTAVDTTRYLTSKLVQDSLKWQKEHAGLQESGKSSLPASPSKSPRRREPQAGAVDEISGEMEKACITSLDPTVLLDIENDARHLATSVDNLVENLSGILHSISALTVETVETYRDGVCKTCDEVDGNIKSMYQLMAKVEELNKSMAPAHKLGDQLKEIKRLLDMFESVSNTSKFKPL